MRICIPITFRPWGGGYYFLKAFSEFLSKSGFMVFKDIKKRYDVLFTNHWMVSRAKVLCALRYNPRVRIVQRIDGAAQDYGRNKEADLRQGAVNLLADLTIFQSQYCKDSTMRKYPVITLDGPVIHNPVDIRVFHPESNGNIDRRRARVACITWSTNPNKGAKSIYRVASETPEADFILCGQYPDAPKQANIINMGILDRTELAQTLRSCHLLLTFSRNEACPNHVLEALATGLPVLYHDSGAMRELVGTCGSAVDEKNFRDRLRWVLSQWQELREKARHRAEARFHPQIIFKRYIQEIEDCRQRPLQNPMARRLWLAWSEPIRDRLNTRSIAEARS